MGFKQWLFKRGVVLLSETRRVGSSSLNFSESLGSGSASEEHKCDPQLLGELLLVMFTFRLP